MTYLNQIDAIYCINLISRKDRWASVKREFSRIGIANKVKRWNGILRENGHIGCFESHRSIYREALGKGFKKILIFEDDARFILDGSMIKTYLENLENTEYDIAYLGGTFGPVSKIKNKTKEYWYEVEGIWNCHAYIISEKYIKEIEKHVMISGGVESFISKYRGFDRFIACYLSKKLICLFPKKILCYQSLDYSDIDKTRKHFLNWYDNIKFLFIRIIYSRVFQKTSITKFYELIIEKNYKKF